MILQGADDDTNLPIHAVASAKPYTKFQHCSTRTIWLSPRQKRPKSKTEKEKKEKKTVKITMEDINVLGTAISLNCNLYDKVLIVTKYIKKKERRKQAA